MERANIAKGSIGSFGFCLPLQMAYPGWVLGLAIGHLFRWYVPLCIIESRPETL